MAGREQRAGVVPILAHNQERADVAKATRSPLTTKNKSCPDSVEELYAEITARYSDLSGRLQQVAQYVIDHPNDMAVETLTVIAERSGVQPSTIVRFAQEFGYEGASDMQRLFRDKLLEGRVSLSYQERVRGSREAKSQDRDESLLSILNEIVHQNIVALEHLHESVTEKDLHKVAELIDRADTVYVTARRRTFPVAASIVYALLRFGKRTMLIDGAAGLDTVQSDVLNKGDLLIAISHKPYAPETLQFVERAAERKCRIVGITDSSFSPLVAKSDLAFVVNEGELNGFRSLNSSATLAQALVLGYAFHRQKTGGNR